MARNKIKFTSGVLFIALLVGANILLLLPQKHTAKINFFFVKITSPLLNLLPRSDPSKNDTVPISEYQKLLVEHRNLQVGLEEIMDKYSKISRIRQKLTKPGPALAMARVSKITIEGQRNELLISKGSADGLKKGQYVLSAETDSETGLAGSVIGTISELWKTMSRVQLITDANHNILVSIWRDGTNLDISGQMWGNNKMQAKIPLIERRKFDIRVDDAVYAKRKKGFLETPLVIGQVSEIKHDDQYPNLWDITITPIVDIRSLTDVAIVIIDMDTSSSDGDE